MTKQEKDRLRYIKNREKIKERSKKWRLDNPKRFKDQLFSWRLRNKTKIHKYNKQWAINNPEKDRLRIANFRKLHPLYIVWQGMKSRCLSPKSTAYKNYGGRGIKICNRWLSLENFESDMLDSFKEGLWIDRINNEGDYTPENCRWVTPVQSGQNGRKVKLTIERANSIRRLYANKLFSQVGLSRLFGVTQACISGIILNKNWIVAEE